MRGKRVEIVGVAGVGERVKINHGFIAVGEPILNEIAADEARAAGDKYGHGCKGSRGGARGNFTKLRLRTPLILIFGTQINEIWTFNFDLSVYALYCIHGT